MNAQICISTQPNARHTTEKCFGDGAFLTVVTTFALCGAISQMRKSKFADSRKGGLSSYVLLKNAISVRSSYALVLHKEPPLRPLPPPVKNAAVMSKMALISLH